MSDDAVARAQAALGDIAFEMLALQERLAAIHRTLPVPPDQQAMLADDIPPDLATEVSGCIECIAEDHLRQLMAALEQASRVTARELVRDFRARQRKRRNADTRRGRPRAATTADSDEGDQGSAPRCQDAARTGPGKGDHEAATL